MGPRNRVGLVIGAGGITGGAWLAGTLSGIATETGWEPGTADLTSAVAAFCATSRWPMSCAAKRPETGFF